MEPSQLRAGDTWKWTAEGGDYPATAGWTCTYYFKNAKQAWSATGVAAGADYAITVDTTASGAVQSGLYNWARVMTKALERYTVAQGTVNVLPTFANAGVLDLRSDARRRLEAVEAVLDDVASFEQQEITIGTRTLRKMPRGELLVWRDRLRAMVNQEIYAERLRKGLPDGRNIQVRFISA